jgi:large subunit ribosomal protein L29
MERLTGERLREMSPLELERYIRDLREELFNIRVRRSLQPPANPIVLRDLRRQIARTETVINQKRREDTAPASARTKNA